MSIPPPKPDECQKKKRVAISMETEMIVLEGNSLKKSLSNLSVGEAAINYL